MTVKPSPRHYEPPAEWTVTMKGVTNTRRMKKISGYFSNPLLRVAIVILCLFVAETLSRVLITEEAASSPVGHEWRDDCLKQNRIVDQDFNHCKQVRKYFGRPLLYHEPFNTHFNITKPAGTFRIIFLGDSMVCGLSAEFDKRCEMVPQPTGFDLSCDVTWTEVPDDDLFTALLEASLNQLPKEKVLPIRRYEVLNFGVEEYELNQIKEVFDEALQFEPDMIIYNYYVDDLNIVSLLKSPDGHGGKDLLISYAQSVPYLFQFPGNGRLLFHSRLFRFLNTKICAALQRLDPGFTPRSFDIGRERAEHSLNTMIAMAREEEVPFVIMLSPYLGNSEIAGSYEPGNFIMNSCHSGLSVWDVSRELTPYYTPEELRFRDVRISGDEFHPNGKGHAAIAEALQQYFERYVLNQPTLERLIPAEDKGVPCELV